MPSTFGSRHPRRRVLDSGHSMNPGWIGEGWSGDQNLTNWYIVGVKNSCTSELHSLNLTSTERPPILLPGGENGARGEGQRRLNATQRRYRATNGDSTTGRRSQPLHRAGRPTSRLSRTTTGSPAAVTTPTMSLLSAGRCRADGGPRQPLRRRSCGPRRQRPPASV